MTGTITTTIAAAATAIALGNPKCPIAVTSSGTPAMPPKLAPFSARLIAMPRFLSNQRPSVLVTMPRLVPAQPKARTALARYNCQGSRTCPIATAATAIVAMPAIMQLRGPYPLMASLTKATSAAPER